MRDEFNFMIFKQKIALDSNSRYFDKHICASITIKLLNAAHDTCYENTILNYVVHIIKN